MTRQILGECLIWAGGAWLIVSLLQLRAKAIKVRRRR